MTKAMTTIALLFATGALSYAGTYYVAPSGSDSNPGSQSQPFATINHAVSVVSAGDTVIVENGTYNEMIVENASGTASAPITFQAQNKWGAVIAPSGSGEIISVNGSYVTFQDFEIIGNPSGTNNDGIKFQSPGTGGQAIGNKVHNIGTGNCSGGAPIISAQGSSLISGNYLYNYGQASCDQYEGIYLNDGNNQTVTNNLIFEGQGGSTSSIIGIQVNGQEAIVANFPSNEDVTNNTIFNVTGWCSLWASWSGTASGNKFNNNICYNTGTNGTSGSLRTAANGGVFSGDSWSNNLICSGGSTSMTGGQSLVNTVTSGPNFVNYTGDEKGDYHLSSGSPGIGAGTTNGAPAADFSGTQRTPPIWDGAYQSAGSTTAGGPNPPSNLTATVN